MEDESAAGDGAGERCGIAQIAGDALDVEIGNPAARTNEGANAMAAFDEQSRDMPAEKARGSGYEGRLRGRRHSNIIVTCRVRAADDQSGRMS